MVASVIITLFGKLLILVGSIRTADEGATNRDRRIERTGRAGSDKPPVHYFTLRGERFDSRLSSYHSENRIATRLLSGA